MIISPDDKKELESLLKSRGWQVLGLIRDSNLMELNKKIMEDPSFDPKSEEAQVMLKNASDFAKQNKYYEEEIRRHTLFVHTPKV